MFTSSHIWNKTDMHIWRIIPVSKWLGSPPFISHETPIWKGSHNPILRGLIQSSQMSWLENPGVAFATGRTNLTGKMPGQLDRPRSISKDFIGFPVMFDVKNKLKCVKNPNSTVGQTLVRKNVGYGGVENNFFHWSQKVPWTCCIQQIRIRGLRSFPVECPVQASKNSAFRQQIGCKWKCNSDVFCERDQWWGCDWVIQTEVIGFFLMGKILSWTTWGDCHQHWLMQ